MSCDGVLFLVLLIAFVLVVAVIGAILVWHGEAKTDMAREISAAQYENTKLGRELKSARYVFERLQNEHAALLDEPAVRERERQAEILERKHELELAHIAQQLLDAAQKREATERFKEFKYKLGKVRFDKRIADDQLDAAELAQALATAQPEQAPDPIAQLTVGAAALIELAQQRQADGQDTPALNDAAKNARAFMQVLAAVNTEARQ